MAKAAVISPAELVLPAKTGSSPLSGELIVFERRKLKRLNFPDELVLFGL
jgi:hypothetical protein